MLNKRYDVPLAYLLVPLEVNPWEGGSAIEKRMPFTLPAGRECQIHTVLSRLLPGLGNEPLRNVTVRFNDDVITWNN